MTADEFAHVLRLQTPKGLGNIGEFIVSSIKGFKFSNSSSEDLIDRHGNAIEVKAARIQKVSSTKSRKILTISDQARQLFTVGTSRSVKIADLDKHKVSGWINWIKPDKFDFLCCVLLFDDAANIVQYKKKQVLNNPIFTFNANKDGIDNYEMHLNNSIIAKMIDDQLEQVTYEYLIDRFNLSHHDPYG